MSGRLLWGWRLSDIERKLKERLEAAGEEIERLRGGYEAILHIFEHQSKARWDLTEAIARDALKQSKRRWP